LVFFNPIKVTPAMTKEVTTSLEKVSASISPESSMQTLSRREIDRLYDASKSERYLLFRQCALAVLNCGSQDDEADELMQRYASFDIQIVQRERGIKLELTEAPAHAFVDGKIIRGIKEHLFSVLRDIVYVENELSINPIYDLNTSAGTTDAVFSVLRNADAFALDTEPNLVVCWGGHSIGREEYDHTKDVGYELGLRGLDICTGCGPGAMKGPMKGAGVAHRKQRIRDGRYVGISEPGIIAAESPNPIVNKLIIMPDIEKRLEAFVRLGHGIVVFPGGVGTAEEIFYLLGLLLHEDNSDKHIPLVFSAPEQSREYFESIDAFIGLTLGPKAQSKYKIIIDNPAEVAQALQQGMIDVRDARRNTKDAYYFYWSLNVPKELQTPFEPNHKNMAGLNLSKEQLAFSLAVNLRAMFSGLVAGNVKAEGLQAIAEFGNYQISGDTEIMAALDQLLESFVAQGRMKINAARYRRCYDIVAKSV